MTCLDVYTTCLQRQCLVKQDQPIVEITKQDVVEKRLENFILHDMLTMVAWWKTVEDDEVVELQYPHEQHGLAGRRSNHAKKEVMTNFLEFVDQPNGRQAGSYSAQYFFVPKFTRIAAPRQGEKI